MQISTVKYEPVHGDYLVTGAYDNTLRFFLAPEFKHAKTLAGHESKVMCLDISQGAERVPKRGLWAGPRGRPRRALWAGPRGGPRRALWAGPVGKVGTADGVAPADRPQSVLWPRPSHSPALLTLSTHSPLARRSH